MYTPPKEAHKKMPNPACFQTKMMAMDDKAYLRPGTDVGFRATKSGKTYDVSDHLGLVYTSDGSDGSGVVSGVGIGRKF